MTERGPVSTQQLVALVLDPRDPGYEAAAQRNGGTPARHWYDTPAMVLGALVLGLVLAVAYVHTNRGAPQAAKVHTDLVDRVRTAQQDADDLDAQARSLGTQLERIRDSALDAGQAAQLQRSRVEAGLQAVHGPGLTVTLAEPPAPAPTQGPGRASSTPSAAGHILTDRDVRSVVNQLWSDGAEAIAVNGIRLTPTSAIRFAGEAVLVDFEPIASPYVVTAIGNADALAIGFANSSVASRYQTLSSAKGVGFSFDDETDVALPGSAGAPLRYAVPGLGR